MRKINRIIKAGLKLFLLSLVLTVYAFGQQASVLSDFHGYYYTPQNLGLSTPNVSDFIKFGNVDINHYNGLLDLDIELDGYKDKDFNIPMSLKYISNGFIPAKRPSIVGNNWILNFGGVITRSVFGSPDDNKGKYNGDDGRTYIKDGILVAIRNGSFKNYSEADLTGFKMEKNSGGKNTPYIRGDFKHDFEPDVFRFSFGNHKGSFIIGNDGTSVSNLGPGYKIDISGLTIQEYSTNGVPQSSSIKIITPDGYTYQFGGDVTCLEYTIPNNPEGASFVRPRFITSWYLKSIKAPNNREVNFTYRSVSQKNKYVYFIYSFIYSDPQPQMGCTLNMSAYTSLDPRNFIMEDNTYTPVIEKATMNNGTEILFDVKLNSSSFYESNDYSLYLCSITHKYNSEIIKNTVFEYIYPNSGKYFFLKNLLRNDRFYTFEYNFNQNFPDPLTISLDHWGFWNGRYGIKFEKEVDICDYCLNIDARKAVNTSVCDFSLLKKITYPSGGSTEIAYENNRYSRYLERNMNKVNLEIKTLSEMIPCGGARIKTIKDYDSSTKTTNNVKTFKYSEPQQMIESGVIGIVPKYTLHETTTSTNVEGYWKNNEYLSCWYDTKRRYKNISSNGYNTNDILEEYHISYPYVMEQFDDGSYNVYHFSSLIDTPDGEDVTNKMEMYYINSTSLNNTELVEKNGLYKTNDMSHFRGKLLSKQSYSSTGALIQSEKFQYNLSSAKNKYNISARSVPRGCSSYKTYLVPCLLEQRQLIDNYGNTLTEQYEYNSYFLKFLEKTTNSDLSSYITLNAYPSDLNSNSIYHGMVSRNLLTPIVEKTMYKNNILNFLQKQITNYKFWDSTFYAPSNVQFQTNKGDLETREEYLDFDSQGNPRYIIRDGASKTVYLWGYKKQYLIADIKGATYDEVKTVLGQTLIDNLSDSMNPDVSNLDKKLRTGFQNKQVEITTYTYKPLIGKQTMKDPRNIETIYKYDDFGRLLKVTENGKIINEYRYNYKNQKK